MAQFTFKREKSANEKATETAQKYLNQRFREVEGQFDSFRTNRLDAETLGKFLADALAHWRQAEKGGAHKGALYVPTVEGEVRITRWKLAEFYGLPNDLTESERESAGQTIQRTLQVVGCLYARHGADHKGAMQTLAGFIVGKGPDAYITPRGLYDACKRDGKADEESVFRGMAGNIDPPTPEAIKGKLGKLVSGLITAFGRIGTRPNGSEDTPWAFASLNDVGMLQLSLGQAHTRIERMALDELARQEEEDLERETAPAEVAEATI